MVNAERDRLFDALQKEYQFADRFGVPMRIRATRIVAGVRPDAAERIGAVLRERYGDEVKATQVDGMLIWRVSTSSIQAFVSLAPRADGEHELTVSLKRHDVLAAWALGGIVIGASTVGALSAVHSVAFLAVLAAGGAVAWLGLRGLWRATSAILHRRTERIADELATVVDLHVPEAHARVR